MQVKQIFIILLLLFSVSCQNSKDTEPTDTKKETDAKEQPSTTSKKVAFYINDRPVYENKFVNQSIKQAINDEIIYEGALIDKVDSDPAILTKVAEFKRNLIIGTVKGKVIRDYLDSKEFTDEDFTKYYEDNKYKYTSLDLLEISSTDKIAIADLRSKLSKGQDFEQLSSEIKNSGINIKNRQIKNTKKYNLYFTNLEIGSISKPYEQRNIHYIFQITKNNPQPYKYIKSKVKFNLLSSTRGNAVTEYVKKLKAEHNIKVKMVN